MTKATVSVKIADQPSSSKGWARYAIADQAGKAVVTSRTGNAWVSAPHAGEAHEGSLLTLTIQTQLASGKGTYARKETTSKEFSLVAEADAKATLSHYPGSQGMRLIVTGARLAE